MSKLLEQNNRTLILPTQETRTEIIGQKKVTMSVLKIPLNLLKYNQGNGRIYVGINDLKLKTDLDSLTQDEYNEKIEELIWGSNVERNKETLDSISLYEQLKAGIVLDDGTVVDGNRRFTCIRKLNKMNPEDERFKYFKAAIINTEGEDKVSPKELKKLELTIQYGQQKPVDYDIVNFYFSIYHNIKFGDFTTKEIANTINESENTVRTYVNTVELINEFLENFNQKGNISIVQDLALFYPMTALAGFLKQSKNISGLTELDIQRRKDIFFDYLAGGKFELPQQEFRDKFVGVIYQNKANFDELSKNYEELYEESLHFSLHELDSGANFVEAVKSFRSSEISKEMVSDYKTIRDSALMKKEIDAPIKTLRLIVNQLNTINLEPYLKSESTQAIEKLKIINSNLEEAEFKISKLLNQITENE